MTEEKKELVKSLYKKLPRDVRMLWQSSVDNNDDFLFDLLEFQAQEIISNSHYYENGRDSEINGIYIDILLEFHKHQVFADFYLAPKGLFEIPSSKMEKLPQELQDLLFSRGACQECIEHKKLKQCLRNQCEEVFQDKEKLEECQKIYANFEATIKKAGCKCKHKGIQDKFAHQFKKLMNKK